MTNKQYQEYKKLLHNDDMLSILLFKAKIECESFLKL